MAAPRPRKIMKMLNGAPSNADLVWDEVVLFDRFEPAIDHFLRGIAIPENGPEVEVVKWRHLATAGTRVPTGFSQPWHPQGGIQSSQANFSFSDPEAISFESLPEDTTIFEASLVIDEATDTFVEQSLVFHDSLVSSNIEAVEPITTFQEDDTNTSFSFVSTSVGSRTQWTSSPSPSQEIRNTESNFSLPEAIQIMPLSSLPSAAHLRSIQPQTPTPTLLCVLISRGTAREVLIRRSGRRMLLHEIKVADETGPEFTISFWSPPADGHRGDHWTLDKVLENLRVGDILLLRNIALSVFRDAVYGQSLNPSITRARTMVDVLMRGNGIPSVPLNELPATVRDKFTRVKRWASDHVASDYQKERVRKRRKLDEVRRRSVSREDSLPPDSMIG